MTHTIDSKKIEKRFKKAQDSLVLQSADLSLETVAEMVAKKAIEIDPKYQRRERWSREKQSALIESFILNVPIPPIYLAEDDYGNYSVIDGKQRLTAIFFFMKKKMRLQSLEDFKEMEGAAFEELPNSIQNALNIRPYVRVVTLLKQSDPDIKYEVFTRLNTGGEPLIPQEIRNVAYRGKVNDLIFSLADNDFLKRQLKIKDHRSKPYRMMIDAEYVLRFFTLLEQWRDFSGKMRVSMDVFMKEHQHKDRDFVDNLRKQFNTSIQCCKEIWGDNAFKRYMNDQWRNLVLAGMYDAQMLGVSLLSNAERKRAVQNKEQIIAKTIALLKNDEQFETSVRQFTSNPMRVRYRIETMLEALKTA
ncbi:MAG: DUF262 domain-containing protein [Planctomycetota bacterium]|nr:MAG: DUF262 domain-containing protein [Planctomycetota bacterium]